MIGLTVLVPHSCQCADRAQLRHPQPQTAMEAGAVDTQSNTSGCLISSSLFLFPWALSHPCTRRPNYLLLQSLQTSIQVLFYPSAESAALWALAWTVPLTESLRCPKGDLSLILLRSTPEQDGLCVPSILRLQSYYHSDSQLLDSQSEGLDWEVLLTIRPELQHPHPQLNQGIRLRHPLPL